MKHGGQRDEDTYNEFYDPCNPGTDGQGSYLGGTLRTTVNDLFRAMTLSRNPELWQSLPAEKQHELTESREYLDIEEELGQLLHLRDDPAAQTRRKELHAQKRKLIDNKLRPVQRDQPRTLSKDEPDDFGHHRTTFSRIRSLVPSRDRLAENYFITAPLRSEVGRSVLCDLITLCQQAVEVISRPGLEPTKCVCLADLTQPRFVSSSSYSLINAVSDFALAYRLRKGGSTFIAAAGSP